MRQGRSFLRVPTDLDSRSTGKSDRTPNMESKLELRKLGHPPPTDANANPRMLAFENVLPKPQND